jgi:hypothetical protein
MVFLTTMLTTADVIIHALIAKYGIDIQIVRPEMTKFKTFRVKVNMDFYFVGNGGIIGSKAKSCCNGV